MEEWEIISEQKKIDRIFHQTGFVPIDIPDFDPDDPVIMDDNNKPLTREKIRRLLRKDANTELREILHKRKQHSHRHNNVETIHESIPDIKKESPEESPIISTIDAIAKNIHHEDVVEKELWISDKSIEQQMREAEQDILNMIYAIHTISTSDDKLIYILTRRVKAKLTKIWLVFDDTRYLIADIYTRNTEIIDEKGDAEQTVVSWYEWYEIYEMITKHIMQTTNIRRDEMLDIANWIAEIKMSIISQCGRWNKRAQNIWHTLNIDIRRNYYIPEL